MHSLWLVIKSTVIGKFGAFSILVAPLLFVAEVSSHIDALIAAIPPTLAVILGVFALRKGQKELSVSVDGKMSQLLDVAGKMARAEGKEEGRGELAEAANRASRAEGKQEERDEARERHSSGSKEPVDVTVVNPPEKAVQSEVINPIDKPVNTISQRQEKIDKAQEKLDIDKRQEPPKPV
jgi:hypothetical protein